MATISDVARHAKVSMKTVSRVLNNEAHVRPVLKERVVAAVTALGYRPNLAARQLAGNRSFIIGYPFNNPSPAYITDVLMGAADACRDRGYHLVSEPIDFAANAPELIERLIITLRPDGLVLIPPLGDMPEIVDLIARMAVPLVRIAGVPMDYGTCIAVDELAAASQMVEHLVQRGHRRIGFIKPHPAHELAQARLKGYLIGLEVAGLPLDNALIQPGLFDVESGMIATRALLDLPSPPTAVFASNDEMALGVLRIAHERKIAIPEQLAIAGFDDSPASRMAWPTLTTVRQPMIQFGYGAVRILLGVST